MKISEISVLGDRAKKFLSKVLELSPLLQEAEFKLDASTFLHIKDGSVFSGSAARAEGGDIQKDKQKPNATLGGLALYGRESSIDDVRKLDVNVGFAPQALKTQADDKLYDLCVKLGEEIQHDIINGTDADDRMLGLSTFVKNAPAGGQTTRFGFTTAELAAMNTPLDMSIIDTADQDLFVEKLMKELRRVPGCNAIICNASLGARLTTIGQRKGAAGETRNSFGTWVPTFDRKPIVVVSDTDITCTEVSGAVNDTTSLYLVRFAEQLGTALSTNSGFYFQDFPDAEGVPEGKARLQMFLQLNIKKTNALQRVSGIRV